MTIHYHGTPITPRSVLRELVGLNFCVSWADSRDVQVCHEIGQSVMLDNGAFSIWRKAKRDLEFREWDAYYDWIEPWLRYHTTWAVVPDSITGDEDYNDRLLRLWPFGRRGAPVWHMHESLVRLRDLCNSYDKVCIGSSGDYASIGTASWSARMNVAFDFICRPDGTPPCWIHMLRGMSCVMSHWPFASVDSTDIGRNYKSGRDPWAMAKRWDSYQCPAQFSRGNYENSRRHPDVNYPTGPIIDVEATHGSED